VSQIGKQKEGTGIKRVNINVEVSLHNAFKATTAAKGTDMTTVLMEFIQNYVAQHGSTTPQKKGRRA
jgi:predicted DNA-binding helix-hairpin-helix protein